MKPIYYKQLLERREKLGKAISILKQNMVDAPEARLRITRSKGSAQYYEVSRKGDTKGKYISKKDIEKAKKLAQADFERKALAKAQREYRQIEVLLHTYDTGTMESISENLSPERNELISRRFMTDEEFIADWLSKEFTPKGFSEDDPEHYTSKGERVRSKSEVILSSRFSARYVPYIYELPITINGKLFYPDFTLLNVRTREVFLWEHLGKMDDENYVTDNINRLMEYKKAGYIIGVNLIVTLENSRIPINEKEIDLLIDRFLV